MSASNFCSLCIEIFKTLNDINPSFIKGIFKLRMTNRLTREKYKLNLEILKSNPVRFGKNSFEILRPKGLELFAIPSEIFKKPDHFYDSNKKLEWNSLLMKDKQEVKLYTFCVFFATLTKN